MMQCKIMNQINKHINSSCYLINYQHFMTTQQRNKFTLH
jgi:hypothetical protein